MQSHQSPTIYVVLFGLVVLFIRLRRLRGTRRLQLGALWIIPALFLVIAGAAVARNPPSSIIWYAAAAAALAIGAFLGWHRGRSMRITVDPASGHLMQTASPLTFIIIAVLLVAKFGVNSIAAIESGGSRETVNQVTNCLMFLALALFSVQRIEMFLRGRRLLAERRSEVGG